MLFNLNFDFPQKTSGSKRMMPKIDWMKNPSQVHDIIAEAIEGTKCTILKMRHAELKGTVKLKKHYADITYTGFLCKICKRNKFILSAHNWMRPRRLNIEQLRQVRTHHLSIINAHLWI